MSPDTPQDPQKGKVEQTTPEEAGEAKQVAAVEAPAPQPEPAEAATDAAPLAAGQAAAETGVDKTAAEATKDKPRRRGARPRKADSNPAGTNDEGTDKPSAKASVDKKTAKAAESAGARKRDRRRPVEPGVLVRAQAKYVRTSARKARLVCDHIRGKDVVEARAILAFTPRAAAKPWLKLLESAVANAEHNHEMVGEDLKIVAVHADEGPTLKRFRPRAMGRATRIRKRTSHLTITLTPKES